MATKRPSYMKRLKEQKRSARAEEKRDARKARKDARLIPELDREPILEELGTAESEEYKQG
jgi:hypothetical protein